MQKKSSIKKLNAWHIKLILIFLMVLNHLEFGYQFVSEDLDYIFLIISRGVAPMFGYLAVDGIIYTSNLKKYCMRLWTWTLIVMLGNSMIEKFLVSMAGNISKSDLIYLSIRTNICITLAAGVLCISAIIWGRDQKDYKKWLLFMLAAVCFVIGFVSEWGIVLLPFMLCTYFLRKNKSNQYTGYIFIEGLAFLFRSEIYYPLVFPLIALYNGERGPKNLFTKYFFYIFYPLHLWVIALINFIKLTG